MKELLVNCQLNNITEISENIYRGEVLYKDKVMSIHLIDLNHLDNPTYLPFDPTQEANYTNEIMNDEFYKYSDYRRMNIYYHFVTNHPEKIKWKEGFLYDKSFCRKSIISPMELDYISKKKVFNSTGNLKLIYGGTASGKTTYLRDNNLIEDSFKPLDKLSTNDSLYSEFIKYFKSYRENHYELLSFGEKQIHNLCCYFVNQVKNKKKIILDNPFQVLDELNLLSLFDLLRDISLNYNNDLIITTNKDYLVSFIERKFKLFDNHYEYIDLTKK